MNGSRILLMTASSVALVAAMGGAANAQAPVAADAAGVEQIVVTGTRLQTGFTTPTPVTVLGAQALQQRAADSLTEIFNQTPAFQISGPERGGAGTVAPGIANPNLRALGTSRTLQLVDGRRTIPTFIDGSSDTNIIPTTMVERVEVSTGGASAAYGSDAIAGVVNIILKRRMTGIQGNVQGGISQYNDDKRFQASLAGGLDFAGGRGNLMLGGQYLKAWGAQKDNRLYDDEQLGLAVNTSWNASGANGPRFVYAPNTVPAYTTGSTVITPGALQGMSFQRDGSPYFLQRGNNWTPTGSMQLQPGNTQNLGYDGQRFAPVSTENERYSAIAKVSYDITDSIHWFAQGEYGYYGTYNNSFSNPASGFIILEDNPYAPQALRDGIRANAATLPKDALGRPYVLMIKDMTQVGGPIVGRDKPMTSFNDLQSIKYTTGLEGSLGDNWTWDLTYVGGLGRYNTHRDAFWSPANLFTSAYAVRDGSGNIVCGPIQTNPMIPNVGGPGPLVRDPATGLVVSGGGIAPGNGSLILPGQINTIQPNCSPYNPFGESAQSDAAMAYANVMLDELIQNIRRNLFTANIAGELFNLPAGPVAFATGVEWRRDSFSINPIGGSAAGMPAAFLNANNVMWGANQQAARGRATTKEGYVELGVPVLRDMPFFQSLDLNGAFRRTDYSTTGPSNTWKVGGTWDVTDWLRFRGVRSRDIRSPGLNELFVLGVTGFFNGATNKVTGATQAITAQGLPNPNLNPEIANTKSLGFIFQPKWGALDGLRFSADWFNIVVDDFIGGYPGGAQGMLDSYFLPCNSARFGTTDRGCEGKSAIDGTSIAQYIVTNNTPFGVSQVKTPSVNLAQQTVEGYDFELSYPTPRGWLDAVGLPGTLQWQANMQWMVTLQQKVPSRTGDLVPTSQGNQAGIGYSPIRLNAGFQYRQGPFTLGAQMNYWSGFRIDNTRVGPTDPNYSPGLPNSVNINRYDGSYLFNVNTAYVVRDTGARRLEVYGVVSNLLNNMPAPLNNGLVDGIGRAFRLGVRFQY